MAKIAPKNANVFGFHGTLKVQSGKHAQAIPLLKRALRLDDGNPTNHGSLAIAYEGLFKPDKAKHHYLRALELDPGQARTHVNLGALLWQEGEHSEAVEHYEQAVALETEFSEAYVYLGREMYFFRRIDEALRCGEAAVRFNPSSAKGHMNLGYALQASGRIEDAIRHYREEINLDAQLAEAHISYTYARRRSAEDAFSEDLVSALAVRDRDDSERVYLHYAAGKWESDLGRDEAAFTHWLNRARLRRKAIKYAIAGSRKIFASDQAIFDSLLLERRLRQPAAGPTPIFIVGMPRSVTTLVEQILASHPQATGLGELGYFADIAHGFSDWSEDAGTFPSALARLDESHWARAAKLYMERLDRNEGEPYISDKMPGIPTVLNFTSTSGQCLRTATPKCANRFMPARSDAGGGMRISCSR